MKLSFKATLGAALSTLIVVGCSTSHMRHHESAAKIDRPDEIIPPSIDGGPADIVQVITLYRDLIEGQVEVREGVRDLRRIIPLKRSYPAMTCAQAVDTIDAALSEAGVLVTHIDTRHVVFSLKR